MSDSIAVCKRLSPVYEARQLTEDSWHDVCDWTGIPEERINKKIKVGYWVVKMTNGSFHAYEEYDFLSLFQRVADGPFDKSVTKITK